MSDIPIEVLSGYLSFLNSIALVKGLAEGETKYMKITYSKEVGVLVTEITKDKILKELESPSRDERARALAPKE